MQLLASNPDLRRALKLERLDAQQHRQAVESIRTLHAHGIRFVGERGDQTCAMYALSLTDDPTYLALAGLCDVYAGKDFMTWAIDGGSLLEIEAAQAGNLVCYFSGPEWRHIGVMMSPRSRYL